MKNDTLEKFVIADIKGKQYLAYPDGRLVIDRIATKIGQKVTFKNIVLSHSTHKTKIGQPLINGAYIEAKVVDHPRGPKGIAFRYRNKKRVRVSRGFRADLSELLVTKIKY